MTSRCGNVALSSVECQSSSLGELALEREVEFDNLNTGIFKLESLFKLDTVNIGSLDNLGADVKVNSVNVLRRGRDTNQAYGDADAIVGRGYFIRDNVNLGIYLIDLCSNGSRGYESTAGYG